MAVEEELKADISKFKFMSVRQMRFLPLNQDFIGCGNGFTFTSSNQASFTSHLSGC